MQKLLLIIAFTGSVLFGQSQTVLNEVYTEPGGTHQEFFELYNSAVGVQSVNCFTVVTYWEDNATTRGVYVLDLPNLNVGPKGFLVAAASNPFATQNGTGLIPNFNWNDINFRNGSTGGYLKKYQVSGATWTDVSASIPATLNDLMPDVNNGGHTYTTLVYVNGIFNNGFYGGGASGILPTTITGLPNLGVIAGSGGCSNFTIIFSAIGAVEFVNSSPGNDNGYARTSDGKCGAWQKTSASVNHTPGVTNGGAAGLSGELTTAQLLQCNTSPGKSTVTYNITGVSGSATEADDFAVEVQLYYDYGTIGQLDGADIYQSSLFDATVAEPAKSFIVQQTQAVILVYKTKRGCFDKVVSLTNGCISLPVEFSSFTATRNHSAVVLTWETSMEQNSAGFTVERNINGNWQQVADIVSQAPGGFSNTPLVYQYTDLNNVKGITQYRIRQRDLDSKYKYSTVRAVRGEGQIGRTIVFPNPASDGKVNVVFEDAAVVRDISLFDLSGRVIRQWKGVTNNTLQVENLGAGIYSLRILVRETGEQSIEKIIVNKR
jgi:hypothetical protein